MRVTMNIFSGRPNPTWTLTSPQATELVDRVAAEGAAAAIDEPPVLGFRGFTVDADLTDLVQRAGVPARFVVPPPAVMPAPPEAPARPGKGKAPARPRKGKAPTAARPNAAPAATKDVSRWLLSTASGIVDDEVLEAAQVAIEQSPPHTTHMAKSVERVATDGKLALATADRLCEPFLTPVQVAFWDAPFTRFNNNCYNYATNFASNSMAQPGRRSGRMYTAFECGNVLAAAGFDGYLTACRGTVRIVALGIWPGFDFHWWRLHPAGFWAHKIGTSPVFQVDNSGRILGNGLTPANCDRGPYTTFCGFFFGPLGVQVL